MKPGDLLNLCRDANAWKSAKSVFGKLESGAVVIFYEYGSVCGVPHARVLSKFGMCSVMLDKVGAVKI